jgi:hypothetical protein
MKAHESNPKAAEQPDVLIPPVPRIHPRCPLERQTGAMVSAAPHLEQDRPAELLLDDAEVIMG